MKTEEIAAEMIYAAKIEESVVIRDSLSTVVGFLKWTGGGKMTYTFDSLEDLPDDEYEECVAYGFDDGGVYGFCEED